jgi:alpha-amylase
MQKYFSPVPWSHQTNIYEVNLRQYSKDGNFKGFQASLPRLREMGVETLWFMPITPIGLVKRLGTLGSYYACSSYVRTNPEYGSLEDFRELVDAAHRQGMKVIIDWVANHTAWDHEWTVEHPEFYRKNDRGEFYDPNGWQDVIDLDYENAELRTTMIRSMRLWVEEYGIDGFRCDMAHLVPLEFWSEARSALDAIRPLFWLAECEEPSYHEVFDCSYTWQWLHTMESLSKGQVGVSRLWEVLEGYRKHFPAQALRVFFTSNHDENSHSGSEYERLGEAALPFAVFCATWDGIPLIYSGQELPNRRRLRFFDKDPIDWNPKPALHAFYKTLLELKKNNPALRTGDPRAETLRLQTDADNFVFAFLRRNGESEVLVLLNLSPADKPLVQVRDLELKGDFLNVFSNNRRNFSQEKYFALRPWEYQVYSKP